MDHRVAMSEANYAAILHGPNDVRIEKWPMPEINDNEVLIKMECVGVCGSDVKLWSTGKCGWDVLTEPIVIGHEGAGVVAKVGANVRDLRVGDRVAIEPTQPCRACTLCRTGRYNLCPDQRYCSSLGADGNLATYYKHIPDYCHKMPSNLSMEEGAAVQPLAIAIHACNRAGIQLGQRLAIFGSGPVGLLCAMAARAMGATKILMTDVTPKRLEVAKALAADHTLLVENSFSDQQTADKIEELLGGRPDVSIDACAFPSATRAAMLVTATGGVVLIVGIGGATVEVPLCNTMLREVDIRGSYRIANTYPAAISAVSSGAIDLKKFITHHVPLADTQRALQLAQSGEGMKVIVHVQK
ncbi:sorbitol dehydrogenase-like [Cydia splendana]|uniref:sorbitol dehydrogenase-like n=1 Tax=Cydia splendana TaxID=1100963 RepID=UPI0028F4C094